LPELYSPSTLSGATRNGNYSPWDLQINTLQTAKPASFYRIGIDFYLGINHIGLLIKELATVLAFYQGVSGFKLVSRETIRNSSTADKLFGHEGIECEVAVLEALNMLFKIIEFSRNRSKTIYPWKYSTP
jgi:hypothetical protein